MVSKIKHWIRVWENRCYKGGIPDDAPVEIFTKVPSYKRVAIAVLKNDHRLTSLGFTAKESKYYSMLKRKELQERGVIKKSNQLEIFSNENYIKERGKNQGRRNFT